MALEITLQVFRCVTSAAILECINQSSSFVFDQLTTQDKHLLLKADLEDGYWYKGLKIK